MVKRREGSVANRDGRDARAPRMPLAPLLPGGNHLASPRPWSQVQASPHQIHSAALYDSSVLAVSWERLGDLTCTQV